MGNKIVTEADRRATPKAKAPKASPSPPAAARR